MKDKSVAKQQGRWDFSQLEEAIRNILPEARLWEDNDGEICVATGLEFPEKRYNAGESASFDWQHFELHPFSGGG